MSSAPPRPSSDKLTVLVFKENFAARTFQVPLKWFSHLGVLLGLAILITAGSATLAFRFYRKAASADLSNVESLQAQIASLKRSQSTVQSAESPPPESIQTIQPSATLNTLPKLLSAPVTESSQGTQAPITISAPVASWQGKQLGVNFNILYSGEDGKSQQGRIIVLARGPGSLIAYPSGVITASGGSALFSVENGEYFSVARFRETHAEFEAVEGRDAVRDAEILLFGQDPDKKDFKLLLRHSFKIPPNSAPVQKSSALNKKISVPAPENSKKATSGESAP